MRCVGEVTFDEVFAMGGVEPAERGIDDGGNGASRGAGEAPEHGSGEQLAFAGREAVEREREPAAVSEGYFEGFWVDTESLHEIIFT